MNRAEFMRRLAELLGDVAPTEREEAIQYYNDYFDDAGTENESGVIASLGFGLCKEQKRSPATHKYVSIADRNRYGMPNIHGGRL